MQTIVNNITEPTVIPGSALTSGDTVELSGKHFVVTQDSANLFCYEDKGVTPIVASAGYNAISVTVTLAN